MRIRTIKLTICVNNKRIVCSVCILCIPLGHICTLWWFQITGSSRCGKICTGSYPHWNGKVSTHKNIIMDITCLNEVSITTFAFSTLWQIKYFTTWSIHTNCWRFSEVSFFSTKINWFITNNCVKSSTRWPRRSIPSCYRWSYFDWLSRWSGWSLNSNRTRRSGRSLRTS